MSKKRKTRREKEVAHIRHLDQISNPDHQMITYSIPKKVTETIKTLPITRVSTEQKDIDYLRHDIVSITAASGIIVAFDLLLFVLLTTNTLHLNVLGY